MFSSLPGQFRTSAYASVDRGVEQAEVVDDATGRDQALAGLPYLVVDDVDPVVVIGGQLAPRVTVQDGGGALRGGRCGARHVDEVGVGRGKTREIRLRQVGVGGTDLDVSLVGEPLC